LARPRKNPEKTEKNPWNGDLVVVLNTNEETEKIFDVEDGVVVETQPDDIFEIFSAIS
jgi:hypothetical protein